MIVRLLLPLGLLLAPDVFASDGGAPPADAVAAGATPAAETWTLALDALSYKRSGGGVDRTLVARVPGDLPFSATTIAAGVEAFNANGFPQRFAAGWRATAGYRLDARTTLAIAYFDVGHFGSTVTVGPESPADWYVMRAPGKFPAFWQTQDFAYQGMAWSATSSLQGAEAGARWNVGKGLAVSAGVRWLRLQDELVGNLSPLDRNEPLWKTPAAPCGPDPSVRDLAACPGASGQPVAGYAPFWTTTTTNDLVGAQAGIAGTIVDLGPVALSGAVHAGLYANRATQADAVSMQKQMYYASATSHSAAGTLDAAVALTWPLGRGFALSLAYECLWIDRVALAPAQIGTTYSGMAPTSLAASGVNTGSSVLFQGGSLGIRYTF
ncbi:MAG: hypothetical protein U1F10_16980 [Burkholderiales bacterium]